MKPLLLAILAFPVTGFTQYTYRNLEVNYLEKNQDAASYTFENIRLYPVRAKESFITEFKSVGKYMTLQDALEKNKVRIMEKNSGGTVNTLSIENISGDTIIIITGDMVKGGKQDRIINTDMVLNPESGKKDLPVYCVESGRWSVRASLTADNSSRIYSSSAGKAAPADFSQHYNKGSVSLRKVVEKEKNQSKVWDKVEELNKANKTETATKTYTAISQSADFNKKAESYLSFFRDKFSGDNRVVGLVVAIGDKVIGCDIFASHDLFMGQYRSLLHSYITEAIINGKPVSATPAAVKSYTDQLLTNESIQRSTLKEKGSSFTNQGKKLRITSYD